MGALNSAAWGALAASSLLLGAWLSVRFRPTSTAIGLIMGFGAGALISAVSYELVPEAARSGTAVVLGLAVGALVFYIGDWYIDRSGGADRKSIASAQDVGGSGKAIFLGTLLDGIPESLVLGMALSAGEAAGLAFMAAVFFSNLPEAMAATSSMLSAGQARRTVYMMWLALVAASSLSAGIGHLLASEMTQLSGGVVQAFAAGAVLTMLADTMMPEAFKHGGRSVGLVTVLGFAFAASLSALE